MKVIALLPMKGHSERIPDKNMKLFAGKPLYHAIMQELSNSNYVEKIAINTDSERIANDVQANFDFADIIFRPKEIQGDYVSMNKIIAHDLEQFENEHFLQTHSTNPLVTENTINKAIEEYFNRIRRNDALFSVNQIQSRLYWQDGRAINHSTKELLRTQDLPPIFEENSNLYVFSKSSFRNADNNRIGLNPQMFIINKLEAIDIDKPEDWEIAEYFYNKRNSSKGDC
jgi:CMP-N-acetylneuraminic acid synthetase